MTCLMSHSKKVVLHNFKKDDKFLEFMIYPISIETSIMI